MALILIRGENKSKILNAIADVDRHAKLTLISKPKFIDANFADNLVEKILKTEVRTKSKIACAFFTRESSTSCILKIKKIHPPAHIVVVSSEYDCYDELKNKWDKSPIFDGYYSNKESSLKDYKV